MRSAAAARSPAMSRRWPSPSSAMASSSAILCGAGALTGRTLRHGPEEPPHLLGGVEIDGRGRRPRRPAVATARDAVLLDPGAARAIAPRQAHDPGRLAPADRSVLAAVPPRPALDDLDDVALAVAPPVRRDGVGRAVDHQHRDGSRGAAPW